MQAGNSAATVALLALCMLVLLEVVSTDHQFYMHGRYGKRAPGPFGGVARVWGSTNRRRSGDVEPRSDKFFLNSRYGKRAPTSEQAVGWMPDADEEEDQHLPASTPRAWTKEVLLCQYTGAQDLFRCFDATSSARSVTVDMPTTTTNNNNSPSAGNSGSSRAATITNDSELLN